MKTNNFNKLWEETGKKTINIDGVPYPVIEKEEWKYVSGDGALRQVLKCLDQNVFYFETSGTLSEAEALTLSRRNYKIYLDVVSDTETIYVISNLKLAHASKKARKIFRDYINTTTRPIYWVVYGMNSAMRTLVRIYNFLFLVRTNYANDFEGAFRMVQKEKKYEKLRNDYRIAQDNKNEEDLQLDEEIIRFSNRMNTCFHTSKITNTVFLFQQVSKTTRLDIKNMITTIQSISVIDNYALFHFENYGLPELFRRIQLIQQIEFYNDRILMIREDHIMWNLFFTLLSWFFPVVRNIKKYSNYHNLFDILKEDYQTTKSIQYFASRSQSYHKEHIDVQIATLTKFLRDLSMEEDMDHALPELKNEDPFSELFTVAQLVSHDMKDSYDQMLHLNEKYVTSNKELKASLDKIQKINAELEAAKNKAEESDRLKTAFLQNLSHEIRTPMNGIMGFTRLLLVNFPELSADKQKHYLEIIAQSSDRMLNMINDLIDISKIETGQVQVNNEEVSINRLLDDMYQFFSMEMGVKKIEFRYRKTLPEPDSKIYSDKTKLNQVLVNLIKNAAKFTQEGEISFGYELKGEFLEFFVSDTGIGIKPEFQERIFERFSQEEMALDKGHEGSGIGLSIAKAYVELLGGKIWVDSELNRGTVFRFIIPYVLSQGSDETQGKETPAGSVDTSISVLLVEDDQASSFYIGELLKKEPIHIEPVFSGREAVEAIRSGTPFDIVLMDIKMPGMDGYEATRKIKEIQPGIPVIAQTAYAMKEEKEQAFEAGCDDYIVKPIDPSLLMEKIQKYST